MAFTAKIPYNFGDILFLTSDPEQKEYTFVGFEGRPGSMTYLLDYLGDEIQVYDFQTSREKDVMKALGEKDKTDED